MLVVSPPCREHLPGTEEGFHGGVYELNGPHALSAATGCLDLAGVDSGASASAGGFSRPETVRTDATFGDRVAIELLPTVDRQEAVRGDANFEDRVVAELLPAVDRQEAVHGGGASFEDKLANELLPAVDRQEAVRSDLAFEDRVVDELERRIHPASTAASLEEQVAARVAPRRDAHCEEDEQSAPQIRTRPVSTAASFEDKVAAWLAPRYEDGLDLSLLRPSASTSMVASSAGLRPVSTAASLEDSVANRLLLGTGPPTPSAPSAPKEAIVEARDERTTLPRFARASPAARDLARRNESERQHLDAQGWRRKWGKEWTHGYPTDRQLLHHADDVTTDREPANIRARRSGGRAVEPLPSVQNDTRRCAPSNTGKLTRQERIRLRGSRSVPNVRNHAKNIDCAKDTTYAKGIEFLSFERRVELKAMKGQQRDKLSLKAWSAVYNSQASKHPFVQWYSSSGIRRPWPEHLGHQ